MPQAVIRRANLCAMTGDKSGYDSLVKESREILKRALKWRVMSEKSEVFFKALMLMNCPGIYYMYREK